MATIIAGPPTINCNLGTCVLASATQVDVHARLTDNHATFGLIIGLGVAVSVIIGLIASMVVRWDGATIPRAIMTGGSATALALTAITALIALFALM